MINFYNLLLLNLYIILISSQERHKVEDLFNGLYTKDIYSGYLKTDVEGNELFYVFTPSQTSPEKDPFFLWLNGGPGCSSLFGLLGEIGPVISVPFENKFILNEYSWNKKANILFIESPAGVGFSKIIDYNFFFNDTITAIGLNIALQNFFSIFTEFQNNDFYITGESYAGTYIPYLVKEIKKNNNNIKINLKGFIIGNPYTSEETDYEDSMVEFGFSHGIIEYNTFKQYLNHCPHLPQKERFIDEYFDYDYNYTYEKNLKEEEDDYPIKYVTHKCNQIRREIGRQYEGINFYGIYNKCPPYEYDEAKIKQKYNNIDYNNTYLHSYKNNFLKIIRQQNFENYLKKIKNNKNNKKNKNFYSNLEPAVDFMPGCEDDYFIDDFLNDNTTKRKLGVNESIYYYQCAYLNYKWGESINFYREYIQQLTKEGFKAWLFSGTEDIAVATLGTLRWINYSNYTVEKKWKSWHVDGQVAGMEQKYTSGLTLVTVKGCGHMVPQDNPRIAKALFDKFLESES